MKHAFLSLAGLCALVLSPTLAVGDAAAGWVEKNRAFFGVEQVGATTLDALMVAPWADTFDAQLDEQGGIAVTIATCPAFFAARDAGLEPDAPSQWPVYRAYGLRCLAMREMTLFGASVDLDGVDVDAPLDASGSLPLAQMFADLGTAPHPPVTFSDGVGVVQTGDDTITLDILARYERPDGGFTVLIVQGGFSSTQGTYSEADLFVLVKRAGHAGFDLSRRLSVRAGD